ncbi:hypothetical protein EVAR_100040_1 [Eumeta japonica]|uniref:Uncharacterized protein n=1 Tax=Eumeta variegata TaxID=151549 RepID=A0A4C1T464_EUMVA|nr:hypothetical protein EVAR_100040_1 [Eumeta japonica]
MLEGNEPATELSDRRIPAGAGKFVGINLTWIRLGRRSSLLGIAMDESLLRGPLVIRVKGILNPEFLRLDN